MTRFLLVAAFVFAGSVAVAADAPVAAAPKAFWALQPMRNPTPPAVKDSAWPLTPVDRFILEKLEANDIQPVGPAGKRVLIRRATYDLTGLPPTPEEIDAFLADDSPNAFARVVDRLLASPAYGERWGRHWLDVVRYADTAGDNSDYPVPDLYKYRNWVIRAFQSDMPYDRFVQEQIAGDLMPHRTPEERFDKIIATGYLANSKRFGSYEDARYPWHLTIEDTIDNLGRTFLALTINCCRCHDHKFDPLTAQDYYALYGFFSSTRYPWPGIELDKAPHDLVPLAPPEQMAAYERELKQKLAGVDARINQIQKEKAEAEKALKETEKIADGNKRKARVGELTKLLNQLKQKGRAAQTERGKITRETPFATAYAVAEGQTEGKKKVGNACVQIKGDPEHLGPEVPRRFPAVLGGQSLAGNIKGSGRLQLARWLTDRNNPLTARVMVNRIWHYHFGAGIVPTPSDFGKQGEPPTHPELLDYLARRFIGSGWSVKAMHRLIMLSRVYQLASAECGVRSAESNANADCGLRNAELERQNTQTGDINRKGNPQSAIRNPQSDALLAYFRRGRLDAESIRDALLAVSGMIDRSVGGPHPFPKQSAWDFTQHKPFKAVYETRRRSVYLMVQRIQRHPFLGLFDGADTNTSTARRITSTTPLQALYVMNDPFIHEATRRLAARLLAEAKSDEQRIQRAFALLYGRPAEAEESRQVLSHLKLVRAKLGAGKEAEAWESAARALLMNNEFVYVE